MDGGEGARDALECWVPEATHFAARVMRTMEEAVLVLVEVRYLFLRLKDHESSNDQDSPAPRIPFSHAGRTT